MRLLYSILLYAITPLVIAKLLVSSIRNPEYRKRIGERLGKVDFQQDGRPVICLHAVSVGEAQAARPLVDGLLKQHPRHRLLITTTTPTGAATAQRLFGNRAEYRYLPYDLPHAVGKFIATVRPNLLLIMETEIWPNLLHCCTRHGVRAALINARISARSYGGYQKLAPLARQSLAAFDLLVAQTGKDAERLRRLGASPARLHVCPNVKFDLRIAGSVHEQGQAMRRMFSAKRPVLIAASTHEGEEAMLLQAYQAIIKSVPDCLLILAPRHIERAAAVKKLALDQGLAVALRSAGDYRKDTQVFLLDSLGELLVFYASADVAFVGGSLAPIGGHNVLEPAALGLPLITGRHVANFEDIVAMLQQGEAIVMVDTIDELAAAALRFIGDANRRYEYGQRAREAVRVNQGGTAKTLALLGQLLD